MSFLEIIRPKNPVEVLKSIKSGQLDEEQVVLHCGSPGTPRHMEKDGATYHHDTGELVNLDVCRICQALLCCKARPLFKPK